MMPSDMEDAAYSARKAAGAQIRERRLRAGMSQSELGAKLGVADTFIIALERGRVVFSKELISRLKGALPPPRLTEPAAAQC
jgi:transcriptional regulator with XRE-family HTH domain